MNKVERIIAEVKAGVPAESIVGRSFQEASKPLKNQFERLGDHSDAADLKIYEPIDKLLGTKMQDVMFIDEDNSWKWFQVLMGYLKGDVLTGRKNIKFIDNYMNDTTRAYVFNFKGIKLVYTDESGFQTYMVAKKDLPKFLKATAHLKV